MEYLFAGARDEVRDGSHSVTILTRTLIYPGDDM